MHTLDFFYNRFSNPNYEDGRIIKERDAMQLVLQSRRQVFLGMIVGLIVVIIGVVYVVGKQSTSSPNKGVKKILNAIVKPKASQKTNAQIDEELQKNDRF
jgi:uncharacterized membrane protein YvbJ